jgi:hypothetical protein
MLERIVFRNLSCSGGTFLTSVLSANRKVCLLNEFHPLEAIQGSFTPNSLIGNLLNHNTYINPSTVLNYRIEQVNSLGKELELAQKTLFIRWHSYFDYLTPYFSDPARIDHFQKFTSETNSRVFTVIRDPLASYVSNVVEGFISMSLDDYLTRYEAFIAESDQKSMFRYEDLVRDSKVLAVISESMSGSWSEEQLDLTNWRAISGTKYLRSDPVTEVEDISVLDAIKILKKFEFCNIEDARENLNRVSVMCGYERPSSESHTYVGKMLGRLVRPFDALTQERDALTQERDALTQERDALTQERDALTQERDALTQERDALVTSRIWKATKPIRWLANLIKL